MDLPEIVRTPKYELPSRPTFMDVTPDMAADTLEFRRWDGNRNLSPDHVNLWVDIIRCGEYFTTHQGLAYDTGGLLLEGQHRLRAFQRTGFTARILVVPGLDRRAYKYMDSGRPRQAGQMIREKYGREISAGAKYLIALEEYGPNRVTLLKKKHRNPQVLAAVDRWPELKWNTLAVASLGRHQHIPPGAHMAVLAMAERTEYRHLIPAWLESLKEGRPEKGYEGDWVRDPRWRLRERFGGSDLRGTSNVPRAFNTLVKAWNLYALGRQVELLRWQKSEGNLEVVGFDLERNPNIESGAA